MLASMASMTVFGVGELEDQVTTENVMNITTDKDSYAAGETVVITASMESIWGDYALEGDIEGYEDMIMPGAYGMNIICANLIYDTDIFTAKKHTDLLKGSGILNADANEASVSGNNPIEAKANGAYYLMAESDIYNADYSGYGFFSGSGDLWQWNLTIAADAAPGTYYLPVGPYVITDTESVGKIPVIKFADDDSDRLWAWLGNPDSLLIDREVTYKTNYDGPSRVESFSYEKDGKTITEDGTEYECSYVVIVVEGEGGTVTPPAPPVEEDPMSFELTTDKADAALVPGDVITATFSVKDNEGLSDAATSIITFNNTALKLTGITSPIEGAGNSTVNLEIANLIGPFETLDSRVEIDTYFENIVALAEDGAVLVATFEVLPTAQAGSLEITVSNIETGLEASATVTVAGDHAHSFIETTTPATCEAAGKVEQICSCGLTYKIADISKLDCTPDLNNPIVVPATCERDGQIAYNCTVCGKLAKNEIKPALGHDWKTVTTEVSCTTDATSQDVCQREGCGKTTELVVTKPALKHIDPVTGKEAWGEPYILRQPTTNAVGIWAKDCALCKSAWEYEEIAILEVMLGDCNMDGEINVMDVSLLLKSIAKWENLYFSKENADVAGDGRVNAMDVSRLMKYIAKWEGIILGEPPTSV